MCETFFLIGSPRSGSNFLSSLLLIHKNVLLLNEPFRKHIFSFRKNEFNSIENMKELYKIVHLENEIRYIKNLKKWVFDGYLDNNQRVIKETIACFKLKWLDVYFNEPKYIFLYRDTLSIVNSFYKGKFNEKWEYKKRINKIIKNPYIGENIYKLEDDYKIITEITNARYLSMLDFYKHNKERVIWINYDDLNENTEKSIKKILDFMNLEEDFNIYKDIIEKNKFDRGDVYSTFRNKKELNRNLNKYLDLEKTSYINDRCKHIKKQILRIIKCQNNYL